MFGGDRMMLDLFLELDTADLEDSKHPLKMSHQ